MLSTYAPDTNKKSKLFQCIENENLKDAEDLLNQPRTNIHDGWHTEWIEQGMNRWCQTTPLMIALRKSLSPNLTQEKKNQFTTLINTILSKYKNVEEHYIDDCHHDSDLSCSLRDAEKKQNWKFITQCSEVLKDSDHYNFDAPARSTLRDIIKRQANTPNSSIDLTQLLRNELENYLQKNRKRDSNDRRWQCGCFSFFTRLRGYTAGEKTQAAEELLSALNNQKDLHTFTTHHGALHNGRLGKLMRLYKTLQASQQKRVGCKPA